MDMDREEAASVLRELVGYLKGRIPDVEGILSSCEAAGVPYKQMCDRIASLAAGAIGESGSGRSVSPSPGTWYSSPCRLPSATPPLTSLKQPLPKLFPHTPSSTASPADRIAVLQHAYTIGALTQDELFHAMARTMREARSPASPPEGLHSSPRLHRTLSDVVPKPVTPPQLPPKARQRRKKSPVPELPRFVGTPGQPVDNLVREFGVKADVARAVLEGNGGHAGRAARAILKAREPSHRARVARIFDAFDRDGDGMWNFREARRFMLALCSMDLTHEEFAAQCHEEGSDPSHGMAKSVFCTAYEMEDIDAAEAAIETLEKMERKATEMMMSVTSFGTVAVLFRRWVGFRSQQQRRRIGGLFAATTERGLLHIYYQKLEAWKDLSVDRRRSTYKDYDPTGADEAELEWDEEEEESVDTDVHVPHTEEPGEGEGAAGGAAAPESLHHARLARIFDTFDRDGDGYWNFPEARRFMLALCSLDLTPEEYEEQCRDQGADPDVGLARDVFCRGYEMEDIESAEEAMGNIVDMERRAMETLLSATPHGTITISFNRLVRFRSLQQRRRLGGLFAATTERGLLHIYYQKLEAWRDALADRRRSGYKYYDPASAGDADLEWDEEEEEEEFG